MSEHERTAADQFLADVDIPDAQRRAREQMERAERERAARDSALDALAQRRSSAVAVARGIADRIATTTGTVTSVQVLAAMKAEGHAQLLEGIDARFVGVVFRKGWTRVGLENTGSHARPVSVWRKA